MLKQVLKYLVQLTPYRVIRARDPNRFDAIEAVLRSLAARGFTPQTIIDGGANVGDFTKLARRVFGHGFDAHMFEPQPACGPSLQQLSSSARTYFHCFALGASTGSFVELAIDPRQVTTGAHVSISGEQTTTVRVPLVSLDSVFDSKLHVDHRCLLKLDLQGWELEAIQGGIGTLKQVEVILVEVSFYAQAYEPPISQVVRVLDELNFELQDVASLYARPRDNRARQADLVFINRRSRLCEDTGWA